MLIPVFLYNQNKHWRSSYSANVYLHRTRNLYQQLAKIFPLQ